jgi:hypothetical protein
VILAGTGNEAPVIISVADVLGILGFLLAAYGLFRLRPRIDAEIAVIAKGTELAGIRVTVLNMVTCHYHSR